MSRKIKYSKELKIKACELYLSGKYGAIYIARLLGIGEKNDERIREWARIYKIHGAEAFDYKPHNNKYSKTFKEMIVIEYLEGKDSLGNLEAKHRIHHSTILKWVKRYNNGIELKDYSPMPEVYMKANKNTTSNEKLTIVKWCIENDRNFKEAANHFDCSYAQVRNWVIKYEKNGEDALLDKRGHRKKETELSDIEKANRKIAELQKENERLKIKCELLKKAEKLERW